MLIGSPRPDRQPELALRPQHPRVVAPWGRRVLVLRSLGLRSLGLRSLALRSLALGVLAGLLLPLTRVAWGVPAEYADPGWNWRRLTVSGAEGPLIAVALDSSRGRVAVADSHGALLAAWPLAAGEPVGWRRAARVDGISDLHFDGSGALWIASLNGLWRLDAGGRLEDRSPGAGAAARRILRVTSSGDLHVAAGAGGAFVSHDGFAWRRLGDGLPHGIVQAAALGDAISSGGAPGWGLWLLAEQGLWHLFVARGPDGIQPGPARRVRIPGRPLDDSPVDLALDLAGSEVVVVYPRALARTLPGRVGSHRWEIVYPVWPAGAEAVRIVGGPGGFLWLATNRGLLRARTFAGPWARAGSPLASMSVAGVAASGQPARGEALAAGAHPDLQGVLVVGSGGLFGGRPGFWRGASGPFVDSGLERLPEPELAQIQAQALRHAGLAPEYFRGLREGLHRRGWWPVLALRAGAGFDRDRGEDLDQSFTYGQLHNLRDRSEDWSEGFDASISFAWNLGDIAYPPDATELSREARQVISLRDNVLDELTQLYFDRRRALLALNSHPDKRSPEAVALGVRAEELAAGLDAWTGGWFSRGLVGEADGVGKTDGTVGVGLASEEDAP